MYILRELYMEIKYSITSSYLCYGVSPLFPDSIGGFAGNTNILAVFLNLECQDIFAANFFSKQVHDAEIKIEHSENLD
jgi:hypothetical protein